MLPIEEELREQQIEVIALILLQVVLSEQTKEMNCPQTIVLADAEQKDNRQFKNCPLMPPALHWGLYSRNAQTNHSHEFTSRND